MTENEMLNAILRHLADNYKDAIPLAADTIVKKANLSVDNNIANLMLNFLLEEGYVYEQSGGYGMV